jgi:hypothetical protein
VQVLTGLDSLYYNSRYKKENYSTINIYTAAIRGNKKKVQLLTAWGWVLLEKLIVTQLVKKLPIFHGTQRFITVFTRAHQESLSSVG